jgi:Mg-chelatase subunit ChlD
MAKKKVTTTTTTVTTVTEVVEKKRKTTRVALVVDRSGSMGNVRGEALNGLNEQLDVLARTATQGGETFVTYVLFNDLVQTVFKNRSALEIARITSADYVPGGLTAMYDGIGTAINELIAQTGDDEDVAYLVVVISDGQNNVNNEFNSDSIAKRVRELQGKGNWTFTMMLSNVDLSVAKGLGLDAGSISAYTSTTLGTQKAFSNIAASTDNYMQNTRGRGMLRSVAFYNNDQTVANTPVPVVPTTTDTK